jgi:predicted  nucleic acid-binding Zn-ribbon protein
MPDLFSLYKLHQVDAAMVEVKQRHDHMDPGREIAARIQTATRAHLEAKTEADRLVGELKDLELEQKSIEEKLKKLDKQLYGGTIISPREVETFQKEMKALKLHRDSLDGRIIELWDLVPPAQKREKEEALTLTELKAELEGYQKSVVEERAKLAAEYKALAARRPKLAEAVNPSLLKQYEVIRQKYGGIGMTEALDNGNCARCGMTLPRKSLEAAARDQLVTCESCHRIVFKVVPHVD